jgi:hypothetical protein
MQRRFSAGLTFGAAYTWSKSLTTANADEDYQDPWNPRGLDYKVADWDRTHVLVFNYVYDLPKLTKHFGGPKWLSYLTDNFELSGITTFETGQPLDTSIWTPANVLTGSNQWGNVAPAYFSGGDEVNKVVGTSRINTAALVTTVPVGPPVPGPRTTLRGGGVQNWDLSLFKNIPLGSNEERYIQLRLEAFNVFNHPNFQGVNLSNYGFNGPSGSSSPQLAFNTRPQGSPVGSSDVLGNYFGEYNSQYSGPGGPRVIQLAAKIYF